MKFIYVFSREISFSKHDKSLGLLKQIPRMSLFNARIAFLFAIKKYKTKNIYFKLL